MGDGGLRSFSENLFPSMEPLLRCGCGRRHLTPVKEIVVASGAREYLAGVRETLGLGARALLVADTNTYEAAGRNCLKILRAGGCSTRLSLFSTNSNTSGNTMGNNITGITGAGNTTGKVLPDEQGREKIFTDLRPEVDFLVAVGSGTINDLVRYTAFQAGKPFVSIPTAPSMDGYTSVVSSLITRGFKRTYHAAPPVAVYADLDVLKKAPAPLLAAGFGDLLGKFTARADWLLAHIINEEYYCGRVADLILQAVTACTAGDCLALASREEKAVRGLMEGLILTGLAMLWTNSSRPASGTEHLLAHFWEMKGLLQGKSEHLHGTAVGVGAWIAGNIYRRLLAVDFMAVNCEHPRPVLPERDRWESTLREVYGPLFFDIQEVNKDRVFSRGKQREELERAVATAGEWQQAVRSFLPEPERVRDLLHAAGAPATPEELGISPEEVREGILYAKESRRRYTALDLIDLLGWSEETAASFLKRPVGGY